MRETKENGRGSAAIGPIHNERIGRHEFEEKYALALASRISLAAATTLS